MSCIEIERSISKERTYLKKAYPEMPLNLERRMDMDDRQIIELYNERSEAAISETADKYGKYCHYIAYNILYNEQDSEKSSF